MKNNIPVIFCHYGDSEYLKYTLKSFKITNPGKRCILLGDKLNINVALQAGWEHFNFSEFSYGERRVDLFNSVFVPIYGKRATIFRSGSDFWVKFVSLRWFVMVNFARRNFIDRFWTFDSDTMMVCDLEKIEGQFIERYDFTEQCFGGCINGFIGNLDIVEKYLDFINNVFQDEVLLNKVRAEFADTKNENDTRILGEMDIYARFKQQNVCEYSSKRIAIEDNDSVFDDCLIRNINPEYESTNAYQYGKMLKVFTQNGSFYFKKKDGKVTIVNSLNLSCIPISFMKKILFYIQNPAKKEVYVKYPTSLYFRSIASLLLNKNIFLKKSFIWLLKIFK
ncbi:MAG: hypothetical protein RL208_423 [Pseudomonadota bacterium]|jgi:hypothetical protein